MNILHDGDHPVNLLYCWRDLRRLVHLAYRTRELTVTLCNKSVGAMNYVGREDLGPTPTCIQCVRIR